MYVPTPGKKTTGLEPHPCVVHLLTLSLANYILLSPVCWVSLNGLPCGFTLEACYPLPAVLVVYLLTLSLANYILLGPVCWIALEGHPAGLPLRLVIPCLRCLGFGIVLLLLLLRPLVLLLLLLLSFLLLCYAFSMA